MDIFQKATMTCRRILEYKALMATPEGKEYRKARKAYEKAKKTNEETKEKLDNGK